MPIHSMRDCVGVEVSFSAIRSFVLMEVSVHPNTLGTLLLVCVEYEAGWAAAPV